MSVKCLCGTEMERTSWLPARSIYVSAEDPDGEGRSGEYETSPEIELWQCPACKRVIIEQG